MFDRFLKGLNNVVTVLAALMLFIMLTLVILQVLYRYVLQVPFPESSELAVYAMVYVVMLGSTVAVYKKTHIAVTLIADKCPLALRTTMYILAYIAMIVFFGLLVEYGWALTLRSMRQLSPSTGIPVGYVVFSIPSTSVICILYTVKLLIDEIKNYRREKAIAK